MAPSEEPCPQAQQNALEKQGAAPTDPEQARESLGRRVVHNVKTVATKIKDAIVELWLRGLK